MKEDVYKVTEELAKELSKGYDIDLFDIYLINEIDKIDEELRGLDTYHFKYETLQEKKKLLNQIRETYHNLQK